MNIEKIIETNRKKYVKFLKKIIKADSYNPPGNECNVARKIKAFLKKYNIESEIFPLGNNRANLFASLHQDFDTKNLLFNGHMDVVPLKDKEDNLIPPKAIEDCGLLYGRGTADMKSSLAAMAIVLTILKQLNIDTLRNVMLNAVADEEVGAEEMGTKLFLNEYLRPRKIKCDFAIVGEYTGFGDLGKGVFVGEKGGLKVWITAHGKSAHSSVPHLGINAIDQMRNVLSELPAFVQNQPKTNEATQIERILQGQEFTSEEATTLNNIICNITFAITEIQSFSNLKNVVPDRCKAFVDFRIPPGCQKENLFRALGGHLEKNGFKVILNLKEGGNNDSNLEGFVELKLDGSSFNASFWEDWEGSKEVEGLSVLVKRFYHNKSFIGVYPAGTDAEYYRELNYCKQVVLLGAGDYKQPHTEHEFVDIEDFINIIKVYTLFAYHFLTGEPIVEQPAT